MTRVQRIGVTVALTGGLVVAAALSSWPNVGGVMSAQVLLGANGDIFVADGHGDNNNRVMKFTKDGTFIKSWGKTGGNPGEFHTLHAIAIDNAGKRS